MLEQSLVTTRSRGRRFLSLPVSIGVHVAVVAAAVAAAVWNVTLPIHPPDQIATYSVGAVPATPAPPPARRAPLPPATPRPTPSTDRVAPVAVPAEIPDVQPQPAAPERDAVDGSVDGGSPDGADHGVIGGAGEGGGQGGLVPAGPPPILRPGGNVTIPQAVSRIDPAYPEPARIAGLQGIVTIECVIGRDGSVRDARVFRSAHPILDRAALDAVRKWRFRPATLNGAPVDVWFYLTVRFALER